MERLGSKTAARQLAARAGVPMVPGTKDPIENLSDAGKIARELGYPVLLKAVAGGGGKGMRLVAADSEMAAAWRDAASEALNAFGDARLYLEKYVDRPRHIEIQIFGDAHGHIVHLGERECSVQRRHQKVIEESPSPDHDAGTAARHGRSRRAARKGSGLHERGHGGISCGRRSAIFIFSK